MAPTFCPNCSNCMTIARTPQARTEACPEGLYAFQCRTCPYQFVLDAPYVETTYMKKKQRDDVMGEEESNLPVVEVAGGCPGCQGKRAFFFQLQTRSADEPPTSFYKCVACSKQWREY